MEIQIHNSSTISLIGYDSDTKALRVGFKNGGCYRYDDVPLDVANTFINNPEGDSHGKHLAAHIKGKYTTTKISD